MELIPFYKYLLMVILLTVLFIVFAIGTLISSSFKYEKNLNLGSFTLEHAPRIVTGIYNVTAPGSILILSASTILLLIK